ncbi:hypothetical protein HD806DRAFT_239085 [Xylariaceae sp. AK1471]|nr:hypothetical protein HD806DRAFT_239085 [Xylariaceae sp. AK1471]
MACLRFLFFLCASLIALKLDTAEVLRQLRNIVFLAVAPLAMANELPDTPQLLQDAMNYALALALLFAAVAFFKLGNTALDIVIRIVASALGF